MDNEFAKASLMLLAGNLVYALAAVVLGVICLKLVDHFLLKKIDLEEEIKKGNVAAAIFGSTILLFVAILIGLSLSR
jgi:uncharacterized membrane protein YjfL (UPF0719 family)